jgi:NADPH:quinone reductase-like Zn-dependent oxidoreductase
MLAIVNAPNSKTTVEHQEVSEPSPLPYEAIVEVRAASINRGELRLLATRPDGWRPGQDVSGVVVKPAADGSGPKVGARVVAWVDQAGWAQRVAASTNRVAELPEAVSFEAAATLPIAGMTALRALRLGGQLLGRRVLVSGAAGGVGRFAVELASGNGASVTGVAASPERAKGLKDLGASEVVTDIKEARGPFDLILESVGGPSLSAAVNLVAADGVIVIYGNSSGQPSSLGFTDFTGRPVRLHAFYVYRSGEPPSFGSDLALLVSLIARSRLHPEIGFKGSWRSPQPAFEALRDRKVNGKAVLTFD